MTDYTELHCKTNYSFLRGASSADQLMARAASLGYQGLAITDRQSLAGIVRAHVAAKTHQVRLLLGAELLPRDGWPLVVWVTDRAAYGRLARLLTVGQRRAPKGECWLDVEDLGALSEGLWAGLLPPTPYLPADERTWHSWPDATTQTRGIARYREIFAERLVLLATLYHGPHDRERLVRLRNCGQRHRLPLVAAGDVYYHAPECLSLYDCLTAIRCGTTVAQLDPKRFANASRHLQTTSQISTLFREAPEAIEQTQWIASQCNFSLDSLRYEYPEELAPAGWTPMEYLRHLTWQGAARRYPEAIPLKVRHLLEHELTLISDLHYEAYFLTVWDIVQFARGRGILCQGRGSAANSAVCYCLEITAVDPAQTDLLFERFVSRERDEAPDIDVDFEHERREEVLQYLYTKYGRDRAGLAAEVITYRTRSAIRDVGKALGWSLDRVDTLSKQVEGRSADESLAARCQQVGLDPRTDDCQRFLQLVEAIRGFPRHLSQHVGGMVMTRGPLCELVPLENAAMPGRTVLCWDKNDLDALGILKVDCLALGMLTAIRKALQLIECHAGATWTLANIPPDDPAVYRMICQADTMGVFQIESRAQMSMLPRLRPQTYYDLVVEVAIVRPGPIQGQMVHPYLRRRMGLEPVSYPNEEIRAVLEKTLGVPIFQEQAMRLAVVAAGFTPGRADQLRRAMGAWRKTGVLDVFRQELVDGMLARGLSREFAEQLFKQLRGFGEYGFPESHAASFALLVYVSAWIKHHYPAAFTAALLNSQPMGFYAPAQLIRDAQRHHVEVRPIDINASEWDCTLEAHATGWALRLGMRLIHGLRETDARQLLAVRGTTPFRSFADMSQRSQLPRATLIRLSQADALQSLGMSRRESLWHALGETTPVAATPLFANHAESWATQDEPAPALPSSSPWEQVFADYDATGLSLKAHPLSFYRQDLQSQHVVRAVELQDIATDSQVSVAGLVLLRQRPGTAKGITFVTLEDETGTVNCVISMRVWERFYTLARRSPAWIVHGRLERRHSVTHVIVERLDDLAERLRAWRLRAREFH